MVGVRVQTVPFVAVAVALALAANRPVLLVWAIAGTAAGAAIGAVAALTATGWRHGREGRLRGLEQLGARSRAHSSALAAAAVAVVVLASVTAILDRSPSQMSVAPSLRQPVIGDLEGVMAVRYAGSFRYQRAAGAWRGREIMRITQAEHARLRRLTSSPSRTGLPSTAVLLGPRWSFEGRRGLGGVMYLYVRERVIPAPEPGWLGRPIKVSTLAIPPVEVPRSGVALVPRDGSTVELRGPRNLVRDTDPEGQAREFGDQTIVAVALQGLEDDPGRRRIGVEIANAIGRSAAFGIVDAISAWKVLAWIFGGVPLLVVAHFVNRYLQRRWP